MTKVTPKMLKISLEELREDGIPEDLIEKIHDKLKGESLEEEQLEYFLNKVYINFNNAMEEPGEPCGTIAAQSIGEPGTQMSIPGTEEIIVMRGIISHILRIDDFIDDLISNANYIETIGDSEVVNIDHSEFRVPCVGKDEKMHWGRLRQVSRHPPKGELLKIKTRSGRQISATPSHSFLIRKNNAIKPISGFSLRVGDRIPLIRNIPSFNTINHLNLETYIPKNEAWYGSELIKAKELWDQMGRDWKTEFNVKYTVPVEEDGLRIAFKSGKADILTSGFVYPKSFSNVNIKIPEILPLDYAFGWFIGAYLAEGSNASSFVSIANVDSNYQKRVCDFANSLSISWHIKYEEGEYGPSTSINLSSALLANLLERMCGKGASNKKIPNWALNAPEEFLSGLLQAYFDGDGNFSAERMQIRASSNSRELRDGICLLLSRFGILSSKYSEKNQFNLRIPGKYASTFKDKIGSILESKKKVLEQIVKLENKKKNTYDVIDMVPGIGDILNNLRIKLNIDSHSSLAASIRKNTKSQQIGRQTLDRYIIIFKQEAQKNKVDITVELECLERALYSDLIWDQIISIKLIKSPTLYVYDFSVENYENFCTYEGFLTHNTLRTF
ncbi:MAG: LAGLIDADG family homing endonuclease, partial [Promethearchaeota archaeon]